MLLSTDSAAEVIQQKIKRANPFSFVRLGDGEGALLNFSSKADLQDLQYLSTHFGPFATVKDILQIKDNLFDAITSADLLGIRDDVANANVPTATELDPNQNDFFERFRAAFPLRDAERNRLNEHGARRIYQLWLWFNHTSRSQNPLDNQIEKVDAQATQLCSQWVINDLQLLGFWDELLNSQRVIGLINSSPTLPSRIKDRFSISVDHFRVPGKAIDTSPKRPPLGRVNQHIYRWREIASQIETDLNGKVFLVGAGLVGKYYCHVIKQRGGIALDLGALLDAWDGRPTRGLVYRSKTPLTASHYAPPPELMLNTQRHINLTNNRKKLFVHIGLSKTGTTTIQKFLQSQYEQLREVGFHYLRSGRNNGRFHNHHPLVRSVGNSERPYDRPSQPPNPELFDLMSQNIDMEIEMSDQKYYVMSSELFSNFQINTKMEAKLWNFLLRHDTYFIVYVRNQFDWLVSWYTQAAKNGNMGIWLDEFLSSHEKLPNSERFDGNFFRKIEYFAKHVGRQNIRVVNFDLHARNSTLVSSFLRTVGVKNYKFENSVTVENRSPAHNEIVRKIILRRLSLQGERVIWEEQVPKSLIDRALLLGPHEPERLEHRNSIKNRYNDVNEALSKHYGVKLF